MKKLILIIFLYPFVSFSQWINFAPESAGTSGSELVVINKNLYYYNSYNLTAGRHTLYFTDNGGKSWVYSIASSKFIFVNDSIGFQRTIIKKAQYKYTDYLKRTFDYGKTWPDSFIILPDTVIIDKLYSKALDVFINISSTNNQSTKIVTKLGENIYDVINKSLYFIHFINDSIGYGLDKKDFGIYKTTNGGTSWNLINTISGNWPWSAFQFTSEDTAYALLQNSNMILKSTNGGMSWDTLKVKDALYDFKFISNKIGFALGYELPDYLNRAYFTLDGGISWKRLGNEITSKNIRKLDLVYDNDSIYFFFSFPGGGVTNLYKGSFAFKDILIGIPEKTEVIKSNYTCYPNPTADIITLRCEGEIPCMGKMYIISLQGQTLLSQNIQNQENEMDISHLARGVYFVKVVDEKGVWVSKVVKE